MATVIKKLTLPTSLWKDKTFPSKSMSVKHSVKFSYAFPLLISINTTSILGILSNTSDCHMLPSWFHAWPSLLYLPFTNMDLCKIAKKKKKKNYITWQNGVNQGCPSYTFKSWVAGLCFKHGHVPTPSTYSFISPSASSSTITTSTWFCYLLSSCLLFLLLHCSLLS